MKLTEIHQLPVGGTAWINAVQKYALMSLTQEQENELKNNGFVSVLMDFHGCVDAKSYRCQITLAIVGSNVEHGVNYEEIPH
jgi:hypothetical protein